MKKFTSIFMFAILFTTAYAQNETKKVVSNETENFENFFGTVPNEEKPTLKGKMTVSEGSKSFSSVAVESKATDESAFLVQEGASSSIKNVSIKKSGNSSNDGQSNFYGLNAGVLSNGGTLTILNSSIETDGDGSNAVFSTGEKSKINIKNLKIHTKQNSSRGLDSTYGGKINAQNVEILTEGDHCAAFATDRGEGFVNVNQGTAETRGNGSPVIYSTGNISVKNLKGSAKASEIACIEGKNSINITNSDLSGGAGLQGETASAIMLYQSMSGDANLGTAFFSASSSTLTNVANGPFFYITNTSAVVNLNSTNLNNKSGALIKVSGNNSERGWGRKGANGGKLEFDAENQKLEGKILVDEISFLKLNLGDSTIFTGEINSENKGTADLILAKNAKFIVTADSYINILNDDDSEFKNIVSNGHSIYYNKKLSENSYLHGRTIILSDGGKLVPFEYAEKTVSKTEDSSQNERMPPPPNEKGMKNGGEKPGKIRELQTLSGTLSVTKISGKESYILTGSDNKSTILTLMEEPKGGAGMPPSGGPKGFGGGEPPKDGMQMPNGGNKNMQKPVTSADLKKLVKKSVTVKGFMEKDGKFVVLSCELLK
ncbi:hypothetical protein [Treponema zioleckii]|uniref:hypothetical protein n=1 Tax=Treponema zioleckii TaxID=331680 RepID=UPI00168AD9C5|nr:hypothetical protein [Treponema zioleckii]